MRWAEVRDHYPSRWLVVEAVEARSEQGKREIEELSVVESFADGDSALRAYLRLHRRAPDRELYVLHTDREELEIAERFWLGLWPLTLEALRRNGERWADLQKASATESPLGLQYRLSYPPEMVRSATSVGPVLRY